MPARTWVDCAEALAIEHLVAMGDAFLAGALADERELARTVGWGRGRRGIVTAPIVPCRCSTRGRVARRVPGTRPPRTGGLPRPHCNADIIVNGQWLARADLSWPMARLIVEYDGAVHLDERLRRSDAARRNLLQSAGWQVIVLTADDLRRPWTIVNLVRATLNARTAVVPTGQW